MTGGFDPDEPVFGSSWGLAPQTTEDILLAPGPLDTPEGDRYVSTGLIGVGGMGVVDAVLDRRLGREVARKLTAAGIDEATGVALLAHEARVTARLDHPNVVPVHDAGRTADGRRFFTMRLVRGATLAQVLRAERGPADLPRLLRHLLDACRAVAHAHGLGIVHGDLKPANVLVGPLGETQVADWGLARFLSPAEPPPPIAAGAGTPPWRAPEIEAGALTSPTSDVYALGVILREILSGDPTAAPVEAPVDLLAVLRRATSPTPDDRYPDAGALGEDLAAWLDGRPVLAHAYTAREMLGRLVRTFAVPLGIAATSLLLIAATIAIATLRTARERDRAVAAEGEMRAASARLWEDRALAALARDDRPEAEHAARASLALAPSASATGVLAAFGAAQPGRRVATIPLPGCGGWIRLDADGLLCGDDGRLLRLGYDGAGQAWELGASDAIVRDDGAIALIFEGLVERFDPVAFTRTQLRPLAGQRGLLPGGAGIYLDREHLFLLGDRVPKVEPCADPDTIDGTASAPGGRWWSVCTRGTLMTGGETPRLLANDPDGLHKVTVLRYDPANERLLGGALDGALVVVDAVTGEVATRVATRLGSVQAVRASPSGALAVALDATGHVMLWRPADGMLLGLLGVEGARDAWWADDATLWIANQGLERWEIGAPAPYRWEEVGGVGALTVAPDGRAAAEGVGPYLVERTLADGVVRRTVRQHERVIKAIVYQDPETVLTVAAAGPSAFQRLGPGPERVPSTVPGLRRLVSTGGFFFGADYGRGAHIWSSADDVGHRLGLQHAVTDLVASTGGVWAIDGTGNLLRMDPVAHSVDPVGLVAGASALAIAQDGSRLGVLHGEEVALFRLPDLALQGERSVGPGLTALALSPDGAQLAVGYIDGRVALWSEQELTWTAPGHTDRVSALAFVGDGIVSASWDASVRRWARDPLAR